jgi:uncharacterized protein involved in tellurium resistance
VHTQDAEIVARTKALTVKHISEVLGFLLIEDGATEWTNLQTLMNIKGTSRSSSTLFQVITYILLNSPTIQTYTYTN